MHYIRFKTTHCLHDPCVVCGSSEDDQKKTMCQICGVKYHKYCIRSLIDYNGTNNVGFCYDCLWNLHQNNSPKLNSIQLKKFKNNDNDNDDDHDEDEIFVLSASITKIISII